jgi:putative tryptophan/tyrosine transport system substrate-binding protein
MRRRQFIVLLGGAAGIVPPGAPAQQSARLPTVGYLGSTSPVAETEWLSAFTQRLRELGWIEGRTVSIERRFAEGSSARADEIALDYVNRGVDIIVTGGTANVIAAKRVTSTIPIVFAVAGDPVGTGLVASLARPGGNATGLSVQAAELAGKKLELLREVTVGLRRLAILADASTPAGILQISEAETGARTLGIETVRLGVRSAGDIAPAVEE